MLAVNCSNPAAIAHTPVFTNHTPNPDWLRALRGAERTQAISDLHNILLAGICAGLGRRYGDELDLYLDQILADTLREIDRRLEEVPGDRRFTSWALKTAIHRGMAIMRRERPL